MERLATHGGCNWKGCRECFPEQKGQSMTEAMDKAGFKDGEEFILIPVRDHTWTDDFSYLREMTCKNHPTAVYYTKNPFERGLHIIKFADGFRHEECPCSFSDLMVKVRMQQWAEKEASKKTPTVTIMESMPIQIENKTEKDGRYFISQIIDGTVEEINQIARSVFDASGTWDFESVNDDIFWTAVFSEINGMESKNN